MHKPVSSISVTHLAILFEKRGSWKQSVKKSFDSLEILSFYFRN